MNDSGEELLWSGLVLALYSQVALFDNERNDSYPQWKAGQEFIVFGLHGVAVVTASDQQVEVKVYRGKPKFQYTVCVSGEILIGNQGVSVGNVPASALTIIALEAGKYSIVIYTDGVGPATKRVCFVVNRIDGN